MKKIFNISFLALIYLSARAQTATDSVLAKLLEGNKRFVNEQSIHPNDDRRAINKTANIQKPFAVILTCSDSRVSPELLFDQGIGDLFVVRVAGNIIEDGGLGSIEYAVEHLDVGFVLVLGHTKCGAVTAATAGGKPEGHISWLVSHILPAYEKVKDMPGEAVDNTARENVSNSINQILADSFFLNTSFKRVLVAGAIYHIENGIVEVTIPPKLIAGKQ